MGREKSSVKPLQDKKQISRLAWILTITYMISYTTRINYGAIVSEMVTALQIPKSRLSMALTGSFITYGAGQIISGIIGDRFSPKKLVLYGLLTTAGMNCLLPLCQNEYQMLGVWCVNGLAQAFMWPPMVRIMATLLSEEEYNKASVKVSCGASFGTIVVYLVSPIIIFLSGWKGVFYFSAASGVVMAAVWSRYAYDVDKENKNPGKSERQKNNHLLFSPLMICIMAAIVFQGMLRDGITTWMPSYISETYNLSNIISILTGVTIPIFTIICLQLTSKLYSKVFTSPVLCAGMLFGLGMISALVLNLLTGQNAVLSVAFSALFTACMHGVNLLLLCMVPSAFKKLGNVSTVSGVLNACTYIGSALSTYGIALISESYGWNCTLMIWLIIAVAGTMLCFVCVKPWKDKISVLG